MSENAPGEGEAPAKGVYVVVGGRWGWGRAVKIERPAFVRARRKVARGGSGGRGTVKQGPPGRRGRAAEAGGCVCICAEGGAVGCRSVRQRVRVCACALLFVWGAQRRRVARQPGQTRARCLSSDEGARGRRVEARGEGASCLGRPGRRFRCVWQNHLEEERGECETRNAKRWAALGQTNEGHPKEGRRGGDE